MQTTLFDEDSSINFNSPKPFLKWAGGKTQSLDVLNDHLPAEIKKSGVIEKYFEPFVGGGALFFYLISNYHIKEAYLSDINEDLILTYNVIKNNPNRLINRLKYLMYCSCNYFILYASITSGLVTFRISERSNSLYVIKCDTMEFNLH